MSGFLIYLPVFILLFVIIPAQYVESRRRNIINKKRRKGKERSLMNELLKSLEGHVCTLYLGGMDSVTGTVTSVVDGWISLKEKDGRVSVVNCDYVSRVREK